MTADADERIVFLDDDHVTAMMRELLTSDEDRRLAELADFMSPESVEGVRLDDLTHGLRPGDGVDVASVEPGVTVAQLDPTVLILRRGDVDRQLVESCPRLRLIQRLGQRTEGIDLAAAGQHEMQVSCVPRASLVSVAEHVIMLALALVRRLRASDRAVRAGVVHPKAAADRDGSVWNWAGIEGISTLHGRTMGIVGMGEVGTLVAERAAAMGMTVIYHDTSPLEPYREASSGASWRTLQDLLAEADVVSLHVPGGRDGAPIIDREALRSMRRGALLINTSRGRLVDEDALLAALEQRRLGGAALDVHAREPRTAGDRFSALDDVLLTPHVAAGSRLLVLDEARMIFDNIRAVLDHRPIVHGAVKTTFIEARRD